VIMQRSDVSEFDRSHDKILLSIVIRGLLGVKNGRPFPILALFASGKDLLTGK